MMPKKMSFNFPSRDKSPPRGSESADGQSPPKLPGRSPSFKAPSFSFPSRDRSPPRGSESADGRSPSKLLSRTPSFKAPSFSGMSAGFKSLGRSVSGLGSEADALLDEEDSRLLVQLESIKANFSVVDELGGCYISVKLVSASDGADLPGEKVKGSAPGSSSGLPPQLTAVLGKKARLALGDLPLAVFQLKRKGLASNATVGAAVLALEDVQAALEKLDDVAEAARASAEEIDREVETLTIDATNANRAAKAAEAAVAEFKAGNVPDNTSAATTAASGASDASVATGDLLPGLDSDSSAGGGNGDLLGYVAPSAASVMLEGGEVNQNDGSSGAGAAAADVTSAAGATTNTAAPAAAAATTPTLESLEAALDSANEEAASASLARGDALARQKEAHAEAAAALEQANLPLEKTIYFAAGAPSAVALGADPVTGVGGATGSDKKSMLSRARALSSIQFAGGGSGVPGESLPIGQATFVVSFTGGLGENEGMRATVGGSLVPEDHPRAQGELLTGPRLKAAQKHKLGSLNESDEVDGPISGGEVLDPDDLPAKCPKIEERSNDYMEEENYPNELEVIVVRGVKLRVMDTKSMLNRNPSSDPYVHVNVGSKKARTQTMKRNVNPEWGERLVIAAPDAAKPVTLKVYDQDTLTARLMGRADVSLKYLFDKHPKRYKLELTSNEGRSETKSYGHLDVVLRWRYNPDLPVNFELAEDGAEGDDDDDEDNEPPPVEVSEEAKEKAAAEAKKALENAENSTKVLSGDYTLYVHMIEARDLKAKDVSGTSDPVVYVEFLGKTVNTAIVPKTLSPVWDDSFIMSYRNLDKDDFSEGLVKISVFDADSMTRNDLIGSCVLDAMYVYQQPHHELWKTWVGLLNTEDPTDDGVQGYLKFSLSIVGPPDRMHVHKDNEDDTNGGSKDLSTMVLMPPTIKTQTKWLVITVHFAEYLPKLDSAGTLGAMTGGTGGIDAYYVVQVGDKPPIRSKVATSKAASRDSINPTFNQELWLPVTFPAMTTKIKHAVWDYDWGPDPDDLVSEFTTDIKILQKYLESGLTHMGPMWVNLYGAAVCDDPNAMANALAGMVGQSDSGAQAEAMNKHPDRGSTYRGRVLISQTIKDEPPPALKGGPVPKKGVHGLPAFKKKCRRLKLAAEPPNRKYRLRVALVSGTELPSMFKKLMVVVSWGKYELRSPTVANSNGTSEWYYKGESICELPEDLTMLPDVFVHLCKFDGSQATPFCFSRFKAKDVFAPLIDIEPLEAAYKLAEAAATADPASRTRATEALKAKRALEAVTSDPAVDRPAFWPSYEWVALREDKSLDSLPGKMFPGTLLMRLGCTEERKVQESADQWKEELGMAKLKRKRAFVVRVHVYMGADLPASDDNGLLDPYLKVGYRDQAKQLTPKLQATRDPVWNKSFDFGTVLSEDLSVAPPVALHLFDSDFGFSDENDDFCGIAFVPMTDAFVQLDPNRGLDHDAVAGLNLPSSMKVIEAADDEILGPNSPNRPGVFKGHAPKWYPLMFEVPGDGSGEILASVQLIPCTPDYAANEKVVPPKPNITPPTRPAFLEIVAVGCRNMLPYALMPMSLPHLKFYLDTNDGTVTGATSESKAPTPDNPNFLEKVVMPVNLPENPIFCPALRIAAFDSRLGGASTPNVGNCRVSLTTKCPWSEAYVPPRQLAAPNTTKATPPPPPSTGDEKPMLESEAAVGAMNTTTTSPPATEATVAAGIEAGGDTVTTQSGVDAVEGKTAPPADVATSTSISTVPLLEVGGTEAGKANPGSGQVSAAMAYDNGSGVPALHVGSDGTVLGGAGLAATLGAEGSDEDDDEDDWMWNEHAAAFLNVNYDKLTTAAPAADKDEVKDELSNAVRPIDDGTGVFGDLPKLDRKWRAFQRRVEVRDRRKAAGLFGKANMDDLPPLGVEDETDGEIANAEAQLRERKYLEDRQVLEGLTLEEELHENVEGYAAPFERYVFTRGQPSSASDDACRGVGVFKGCVRICEFNPMEEGSADAFLRQLVAANNAKLEQQALLLAGGEEDGGQDGDSSSDDDDDEEAKARRAKKAALKAAAKAKKKEVEVPFDEAKAKAACVQDLYADFQLLGEPKTYKVRLYVMRGLGLAAMDEGWNGRPGASDPYLRAVCGKQVYDNSKNFQEDLCDCDFFECIELSAALPGPPLVVEVMDKDDWSSDDLIGRTVIDLEERWFDATWQQLGNHTLCDTPGQVRWNAKPVELRPIRIPAQMQPQGHLELWVDILETGAALTYPPDDIALPPNKPFQVRVIIWQAKDVNDKDITGMSDTYIKVGLQGVNEQSTDVHWRAKGGKASWNYRLCFDVDLGLKTMVYKFPYLKIQMWDKDVLKWDDLIAETSMDIGYFVKKAFRQSNFEAKKSLPVKVFEDPPSASKHGLNGAAGGNEYGEDGLGQLFGDLNDAPPLPSGDSKTFASLFEPVGYAIRDVAREADGVVDSVRGTDPDGGNGSQLEALVATAGIGGGSSGDGDSSNGVEGSDRTEVNNQTTSSSSSASTSAAVVRPNRLQFLMDSSSSEEEEEEKDTAGDGSGGGEEGLQLQVMKRGDKKKAVPPRRRDSRTGKQVTLADGHDDEEAMNGQDKSCLGKLQWGSSSRGAKGSSEDQLGDEHGADDEHDDEEALLDGDKPKRRRRKKKANQKRPGDECGCFCCLRCLCRGCCTVMTCKCFSPADPKEEAANSSSVDPKNAANSADAAHRDVVEQKPWFVRRHCPGCFGEGTFAATRPCCAQILRLWCALLELCRKVVMLVVNLCCAFAYYFGKCLLVTICDTVIACCPSCVCLALWCPTSHSTGSEDEDGAEWEGVPEGEPIDDEDDVEAETEEAKGLATRLATMMGRGPRPPDSGWLYMDREHPRKPGEREPMGKVCVSVEIVSAEVAEKEPVGHGRRAPNRNPRLPPPTGRLKATLNPFVMGSQLCGPKICCYITCILLTAVFIILGLYCQPVVNVFQWIVVGVLVPG